MTRLELQIRELSPSVKDALYRRLMFAEDLAWLRDEKKKDRVIGFEVDLEGQELSGFTLIAIQRHTVIAFVSDSDESPRLILFPALETLFDPGFELLDLIATRKEFKDATFQGTVSGHGRFGDMVKDLTPPNRKVDITETVMDQIANIIKNEEESHEKEQPAVKLEKTAPARKVELSKQETAYEEEPEYEEGPPEGFDEEPDDFENYEEPYEEYEDYEDYSEPVEEPEDENTGRSDLLKKQNFQSLHEVTDFVVMKFGVNRPLAVTLANKVMQSKVSPEYRVQLAVNLFCKLLDEDKI